MYLHHQTVKFRQIVLSENPELHLIWYYDRIFIKPIPKYLLSHKFWKKYILLDSNEGDKALIKHSALGYLRTYRYLVTYESDFEIAKEKRLVTSEVTWDSFSSFRADLKTTEDTHVTERYCYGEIRLSRLNFYIKFLLGRSSFHKVHGQYQSYFSRFYGPLFFAFGMILLLLSAIQVEMAVEPLIQNRWPKFWELSRWFSVWVLVFVFALSIILLSISVVFAAEWYFAFRRRLNGIRLGRRQRVAV